jgi:hypothetical protein
MYGPDGASTLMSIRDAARASGLSPKALRRRIERGTLRSVLVGGRRRIPVDDLVRRGLVPDASDSHAGEPTAAGGEQAVLVRRLRALESRVAALESALDSARAPVIIASETAPLLVGDARASMTADGARAPMATDGVSTAASPR